MANLIAVSKLIKEAKKKQIDLGSGDPYNRLRYYTKIGWLPHMVRKSVKGGDVEGHYPDWALERLEYIEDLKKDGLSNTEISRRMKAANAKRSLGRAFSFLETASGRRQAVVYGSIIVLLLVFFSETGILFSSGNTKRDLVSRSQGENYIPNSIVSSGSAVVPQNSRVVFVKSPKVSPTSRIYVSFAGDYGPASRFWVSNVISQQGFYVELDTPVSQTTNFNWWVTN